MRSILSLLIASCLLLAGCNKNSDRVGADGRFHLRLQTDWYPQAEHGGFYYAKAMGYYADEGLDVEILPGGLNYMGALKVTEGEVDFAMHKAESIIRHVDQGMPLVMVMATLQHDPQGILIHADSPVNSFEDLDGKTLMAMPGGTWQAYMDRKFHIQPRIVPHDKGMERFLNDPTFMQQCMVTSEPFYAKLHGVETKVLLLKDSGFDPYHVVYTNETFADEHPDIVEKFVRASKRGWVDFLTKDPKPAFDLIKQRNPQQTDALLNYSRQALIDGGFAFGEKGPEHYGEIDPQRIATLKEQLRELDLIGPNAKE